MSTHYLIDRFNDEINAVRSNPVDGETELGGNYIIQLPTGLSIVAPTSLADLLTKKYAAILGAYAGFVNIVSDDLLDDTGIDIPSSGNIITGFKGAISLPLNTDRMYTNMVPLASTPTQALATWELFEFVDTDPKDAIHTRIFKEVPSSQAGCLVSFNNGGSYTAASDGVLFPIAGADQGNQLIFRLTSTASPDRRLYIGSWSVLY